MPNWCEGTMKVRGNHKNIVRFFKEGIEPFKNGFYESGVSISEGDTWCEISIIGEPYIKGTRRAFAGDQYTMYLDKDDSEQVVFCEIRQAWHFDPDAYAILSKEYGVDFRLHGFECGVQFEQIIEVVDGLVTVDKVKTYDDWAWECPMPGLGG